MGMANDDDYDFSGVSQPGPFDIESSVLSQWRAQNSEEDEDDDYSYFWPEQLPYDIDEKLREINKVHQEDETPIESDRPRKITFNSRVQMRAISMRRIPPPAESSRDNDDEPFDLSKYDTDESVEDVETSITTPREADKASVDVPQSSARSLPLPTPSSSRGAATTAASSQKQKFAHKTAVSRVGQAAAKSPGGDPTSGGTDGGGGGARLGFRDSQNYQFADGPVSDRLSVLSLTDDDDDDCVVGPLSSDTGYGSGTAAAGDASAAEPGRQQAPVIPVSETAPTNVISPGSADVPTVTPKIATAPASISYSPEVTTATKTVSVSEPTSKSSSLSYVEEAKSAPVVTSELKFTITTVPSSKSASALPSQSAPSLSSTKSESTSVSLPNSVSASVSTSKPETVPLSLSTKLSSAPTPVPVSVPKSASGILPVSLAEPLRVSKSEPEPKSTSVSVSRPQSAESVPERQARSVQTEEYSGAARVGSSPQPDDGSADHDRQGTIGMTWSELDPSTERYRPSWIEPRSAVSGRSGCSEVLQNQTLVQRTSSNGIVENDVAAVSEREDSETRKPCTCQIDLNGMYRSKSDAAVLRNSEDDTGKQQLNGTKSEDSALESMDDHTSSNTPGSSADGSAGSGAEPPRRAPERSYAAIHSAPNGRLTHEPARKHDFTLTKTQPARAARPRLNRSASAGRPPTSTGTGPGGLPPRAPTAPTSSRRTGSPVKPPRPGGGSPERPGGRPRSAPPVRSAASAPTLPRRQPSAQRTGQQAAGQSAGASPPPRRRRARSQDPSLTFQQWLQQHEKERAQAIQDRKNNAKKRKQEADIKQEKAPQAFRVWLRKKRQQQLMEQRVQQLRQHELLAAAAAEPAGRRHQPDAFRQWLTRKQRERAAGGRGPAQATLRSLSALYRVGRAGRPAGGGDRHGDRHAHLRHIYGPHVSGGPRCRSAFLPDG